MSDIFKTNIKEWVSVDNELRILTEHVKELRDKRNEVNNNIIRYVETNQLTNSTIQLSDGLLKFNNQKTYAPLTYTFLQETLTDILSIEQTTQIIKYIKEKRETQSTICIKRNIT
jgi:hypothetical protein